MKITRIALCLLIIGLFWGCSGDGAKYGAVPGAERTKDGAIKVQKLEGSEIVVSNASYDQQNPHVIYLPDKNLWFAVWEDWRNQNTTGSDLYGQFINSDGSKCGGEINLTLNGTINDMGNQTVPRAAYRDGGWVDGIDRIMVVWQDTRSPYLYYRPISVTTLDAACSNPVLETEAGVIFEDTVTTSRTAPRITYDTVGDRFFIGWVESKSSRKTVSYIPFDSHGGVISWVTGDSQFVGYAAINGNVTGYSTSPTIIVQTQEDGFDPIRARLITSLDNSSSTSLEEKREYEFFDEITNVDVSCDSTTTECLVVWEGIKGKESITNTCTDNNSNTFCDSADEVKSSATVLYNPTQKGIYGLFEKNLLIGVSSLGISSSTLTAPSYYPSVAFDPTAKRFLVAWEDLRNGSNQKIYGQLVYSGSGLYNNNFIISYQDTNNDVQQDDNVASSKQTKPFISFDSVNQRYFVIWQDGRNGTVSTENLDIYGQYVDAEGSLRGNNYSISTAQANQYNPTLAYNTQNNQFLAVWKDARNYASVTASDVYGQRFSLGQPQLTLLNTDNTALSPALLDFGSVNIGESTTKSFKVKNTGDIAIKIDCINPMPSVPFSFENLSSQLNSCDGSTLSLVPSAEITITLRFAPTSSGTFNSTFTVNSDGGNKAVDLQGFGGESTGIKIEEGDGSDDGILDFGSVKVDESKTLSLAVTNTGSKTISLDLLGILSPFSYQTTYSGVTGISLDPGDSYSLSIVFQPTDRGNSSVTMSITTDDPSLNRSIELKGTGAAPILRVSPTSIDFKTVNVGSYKDMTYTIYNDGDAALSISSCGTFIPPFSLQSNCPGSIDAGSSQNVTVRFTPTDVVDSTLDMTIKTDAENSSGTDSSGEQTVNLKGSGGGGKVGFSKTQIDFGTVAEDTSQTEGITITNTGNAPMSITGITSPTSPFNVVYTGTLPIQLLPNTSYAILVTFNPASEGNYNSSLTVSTDAVNGNQTINLQGVSVLPVISISPSPLHFSNTGVDSTQSMNLTIRNKGTVAVTINSFDSPAAPFTIESLPSTPYTVEAGTTLNLIVKFSPTTSGNFSSSLGILYDYSSTAEIVNITGTGASATQAYNVIFQQNGSDATSFDFGSVFKGSEVTKTFSVKNSGSSAVTINSVSMSSTAFRATLSTPFTLQVGGSKTFDITFNPSGVQSYSSTLTLKDSADSSYQLSLTGTGSSVNVEKTSGTGTISYFKALTQSQLPKSTKPSDFTITKAVEFVIGGVNSGGTVAVDVTFDGLPSAPVFYRVSGNTWTQLAGYTVNGNTISYSITDNGTSDADSASGTIKNLIVAGFTGADGGGGTTTGTVGTSNSGGGGCSIGARQNMPSALADTAVMLMPLFVIIALKNMRRRKK